MKDRHLEEVARWMGISYDEAKRRWDAKDEEVLKARAAVKRWRFGETYGIGMSQASLQKALQKAGRPMSVETLRKTLQDLSKLR